jgi:predicted aspartyl protease
MSSDEDNELLARDMQMALDLQDEEERNQKRRSKRNAKHHSSNSNQEAGFADRSALLKPGHMLFVICELQGKSVEMLVDSGASASVISITMVHQLGLSHHLNTNVTGKAAGVGAANIVGILENMTVSMGHVEFNLFFLVLQANDPWLILGLDQMRRFKCMIDLDKNQLLFGGHNGVAVPFLDAELAGEAVTRKLMAPPLKPSTDASSSVPSAAAIYPSTSDRTSTPTKGGGGGLFGMFRG